VGGGWRGCVRGERTGLWRTIVGGGSAWGVLRGEVDNQGREGVKGGLTGQGEEREFGYGDEGSGDEGALSVEDLG